MNDVISNIKHLKINVQQIGIDGFTLLNCENKLLINLIPLTNTYHPNRLVHLQATFNQKGINLVHLWEDIWIAKKTQVISRFSSFLGLNERLYARKTKIINLDQQHTTNFLNAYHLQGYVKAKYNFGLTINQELMALASFSAARQMKSKGASYQSAELVRFASKKGVTIVGGLSKLIKHFAQHLEINDLMTYADRDWSLGMGYHQLGFTFSQITAPTYLYVNTQSFIRYFPHRLPKTILLAYKAQNSLNLDDFLAQNNYIRVFNTGNLKYHLYFK